MERLVRFLQIKTTRSAWVFLFGSAAMFLFTAYISLGGFNSSGEPSTVTLLIGLPWFLVTGSYMAIAIWALISDRGKKYLAVEEQTIATSSKNLLWYAKFLFACYAAAFASMMLLGVLALPFAEYRVLEAMFRPGVGGYVLLWGFFWAPLIFRYLK
jgi:hypothetical protein